MTKRIRIRITTTTARKNIYKIIYGDVVQRYICNKLNFIRAFESKLIQWSWSTHTHTNTVQQPNSKRNNKYEAKKTKPNLTEPTKHTKYWWKQLNSCTFISLCFLYFYIVRGPILASFDFVESKSHHQILNESSTNSFIELKCMHIAHTFHGQSKMK